jgi:glutamate synthase (NADPH/NADH)
VATHQVTTQHHPIEHVLDRKLIEVSEPALERKRAVRAAFPIRNANRTVGRDAVGRAGEALRERRSAGRHDPLQLHRLGGAELRCVAREGVSLTLEGEANDYMGKGLSGGRIVVFPPKVSRFDPAEGDSRRQRRAVRRDERRRVPQRRRRRAVLRRNSGATAVVEGVGDHGCEYMTGGVVVVLGKTGRNFAAGMSGGVAFVLNLDQKFERRCNTSMVALEAGGGRSGRRASQEADQPARALHRQRTRRRVLANWDAMLPKFVRVMPTEYRKALEARERERLTEVKSDGGNGRSTRVPHDQARRAAAEAGARATKDWREFYVPAPDEHFRTQGARCMDCGVPFCQGDTGCPVQNVIPEWNSLVREGRWRDASLALHATNNFPS